MPGVLGSDTLSEAVRVLLREGDRLSRISEFSRLTSAELVAECRAGRAAAWREIVSRHGQLVFGVARACGLQAADAEDVFQQTFAELARSIARLREPDRLDAWLVTTARRAAIRLRGLARRQQRIATLDAAHRDTVVPDDEEERLIRLRMAERVRREIEAMGSPCAPLLLGLFASPPRPYRELAERTGLAIGSLGATRGRCLDRLRRRLRRELGTMEDA